MNKAQQIIAEKMNYMIAQVGDGPLSSWEEGDLLDILQKMQHGKSIWAQAIRGHFQQDPEKRNDWELINGLANQCRDDLLTMVCVVGQAALIYLLRTLND
jgi:hypothetical protein